MMWYSVFLGLAVSDGLMDQRFSNAWISSPWFGTAMDDEHAMFVSGGEPYPHG